MSKQEGTKEVRYNVHCVNCGSVFQPLVKSALWWRAQKRAKEGYLDALHIDGEECGCQKKVVNPDAPIRVFGYDDTFREFDKPFTNFTEAVATFKRLKDDPFLTIFISGVSVSVQNRLSAF